MDRIPGNGSEPDMERRPRNAFELDEGGGDEETRCLQLFTEEEKKLDDDGNRIQFCAFRCSCCFFCLLI